MSTKLYVGNLAFQTTSQDLQELFGQAGTVESAQIIEDRDTGRSKGFAFVEMSTEDEAASAIDQFNGKELGGRMLKVNEAKPRESRSGGGGGRGFGERWRSKDQVRMLLQERLRVCDYKPALEPSKRPALTDLCAGRITVDAREKD